MPTTVSPNRGCDWLWYAANASRGAPARWTSLVSVCGRGPTGFSRGASRAAFAALLSGSAGLMPGAIGDLTRSASGYPRHPGSYKIRSGAQGMGPELPAGGCFQAPWGSGVTRQQPRRVLAFFAIDPTCATPQRAPKELVSLRLLTRMRIVRHLRRATSSCLRGGR